MDDNELAELVIEKSNEFEPLEPRGYIYRISRELIESKWNNDQEVTEAICLLLHIWNNAFYRFGFFEINDFIEWVKNKKPILNELKRDNIEIDKIHERKYTLLSKELFDGLLEIVKIPNPKDKGKFRRTPVGVAKALHLLLPKFFPLWDDAIARGMGVMWSSQSQNSSEKYLECFFKTLNLKRRIENNINIKKLVSNQKGILKIIDEFNFIYFTKEKNGKNKEVYPDLLKEQKDHIKSISKK